MKKLLIALIFVIACGRNAPESQADKFILNHDRPEPMIARVKLKSEPREIIMFAFPNQSEVAEYFYDNTTRYASEEEFNELFSMIKYGDQYKFDITKDMSPAQKVQAIMGKVVAIADARDNTRRASYEPRKKVLALARKTGDLLKDIPCYEVTKRGHPNKGKCYLKPVAGITKDTSRDFLFENCNDIEDISSSYLTVSPDPNIASTDYFLNPNQLPDLESDLEACRIEEETIEKYENIAATGKLEVAMLVGSGEIPGKDMLLFKAKSELDSDVNGNGGLQSIISFNPETMIFEKFQIAIDFFDENQPTNFGPEFGNMTQPVVTEINGSGFYRVDFEINTAHFTLKTLGLSLEMDPIFGLRVSGKTMLYYHDGRTRPGIMRIDVSPEE